MQLNLMINGTASCEREEKRIQCANEMNERCTFLRYILIGFIEKKKWWKKIAAKVWLLSAWRATALTFMQILENIFPTA